MARILLIDDSPENRAAIESLAAEEGHSVETAAEGRRALPCARALGPDIILIDLLLPGVPSWQVIHELRQDPALALVPIVGMSGEAMGEARHRALAAGCADFLPLPIRPEAARHIVALHLRGREESDVTQTRPLAIGTPAIRSRTRARLLLASRDAGFREVHAAALRRRRYQVEAVASEAELLDRSERTRPHLALIDVELSDGAGAEACRRIKGRPRDPFLPVLLATDPGGVEAAVATSGADDFILRPFGEAELRHRIRNLLFLAGAVEGERDRSRQLATVARQMTIGLVLADAEGRIILMNRASAQILRVEPHELRGRTVGHLFRLAGVRDESGEPLPRDADPFQRFRAAGGASAREIHLLPPESGEPGSAKVETTWTAILDGARKFHGVSLSLRRVTEDADAQRQLSEAYDRLLEVDQLKSKFLSTVSHELRTPLNTIILLSYALTAEARASRSEERRDRDLQIIRQSANALLHMINNLLDLARIEGGQARIEAEAVALHAFLDETLEIVAPQAEKKSLSLKAAVGADVPGRVMLDRDKTRQILLNLASNAIKFTERGEVSVSVESRSAGRSLAFVVRDSGPGIPPDKLSMIFEPFRQAASGEAASAGSGLGLSIVKELVHLMEGEILVTSRPGEGSSFCAVLPCSPAPEEIDETSRPIAIPARTSRILIVEDDENSRYGLRTVLEMEGYRVEEARTGAEALAATESTRYDAVFMDIHLPDGEGTAVIRRIRERPDGGEMPILALTGQTADADRKKIEESGASTYLSKPVDVRHLLKTLARLLESADIAPAR